MLRFRFPTVAGVTATIVIPLVGIPTAVTAFRLADSLDNTRNVPGSIVGFTSNAQTIGSLVAVAGSLLSGLLVAVGISHLVSSWLVGVDPSLRSTLRLVMRRSLVVVVAALLAAPLIGLGLVACFIPGIFVAAIFLPLPAIVANEHGGPLASFRRCWRLSRPQLGRMAGLLVTSVLLEIVLEIILSIIVAVVSSSIVHTTWAWVISGILTIAIRFVVLPIQSGWIALAYLDLRARNEGLDLELEADDLFGARA